MISFIAENLGFILKIVVVLFNGLVVEDRPMNASTFPLHQFHFNLLTR